jgi:RNA polymerase sigma-70 factor (ECF subfamily)
MQNEEFRKLLLAYPSKAIKLLYDEYYTRLVRLALKYTKEEKTAEDVVQETFAHIWENYKKLGEYHERSIQYYLVRVVKNKAVSEYRKSITVRESKARYVADNSIQSELTAECRIIQQEISEKIRQVLATFPKRERECMSMKLDDEMTTRQIAIALNVSPKAVERSITSGNKRFLRLWSGEKE